MNEHKTPKIIQTEQKFVTTANERGRCRNKQNYLGEEKFIIKQTLQSTLYVSLDATLYKDRKIVKNYISCTYLLKWRMSVVGLNAIHTTVT